MPAAKRAKVALADRGTLAQRSRAAWERWLARHHARSPGVWLRFARQSAGSTTFTHAEALEVALRYGWIDGQTRSIDAGSWRQVFAPRGPRSRWSRINREKALALIAAGEMHAAGLAEVERARGNGQWERAYEPQRTATVPADLAKALKAAPRALAFFKTLDSRNRYAILHRIAEAKKPGTRASRIAKFVAMLLEKRTLHER